MYGKVDIGFDMEVERQQNLFNQSHRVHITPLVIHGLGADTHTHTHIHPH